MLSPYIKSLDLNKSNLSKVIDIIKLYPNIYKKYENKTTEIADYNDYHKYLNENDKNHYLNKTNIKNIIWFLKYSKHYEPILITESDSDLSINYYLYNDINYKIDDTWISASRTRNYLLEDPLMDYLEHNRIFDPEDEKIETNRKRKHSEQNLDNNTFLNTILSNGIEFENEIISKLKRRFPNDLITIIDLNNDKYLKDKIRDPIYFKITIEMIKKGIPIIYQGVLHDQKNKVYGLPDLIVRGDFINKIFNAEIDVYTEKIKSINNYPYYIIDIKNSNIHLSAKSDIILNYTNCKPYKGQIAIYHKILSDIQEHDTRRAFILPSKWTRKIKDNIYQCANPFDRLGIIDFDTNDNIYFNLVDDAIKWLKLVKDPNNKLNCYEPNNINMYPNMTNQLDGRCKRMKKYLAEKNDEITNVWMCGVKHRKNAIENGITKWSDPNLNSSILGINGKNSKILDLLLDINRSNEKNIYPDKIKSELNGWRNRNKLAFYVDFETLNSTIFEPREFSELEINNPNANDLIFMIGIGYSYNNEWKYNCILADDLTDETQIIIINKMKDYIKEISELYNTEEPNLYHWSNFEPMILNKLCDKYKIEQPYYIWTDILKMFHEEPIVIKGALNFSLKNIGRALYDLKYIKTIWDESLNVKNGLDAMFQAYHIYKNKNNSNFKKEMEPIIKYNDVDCKIMWEILNALNEKV